jgi:hypothetical protein
MTWAKVDDSLYTHRKRRAAGFEALGLWVVAMSYCAHHLSDGRITAEDVLDLCKGDRRTASRLATRLVEAGLWEPVGDDGYQFHDWNQYQPTRAHVLAERARKAEAGRKGGQRSGEARASTNGEAGASRMPRTISRPVDKSRSDRAYARELPDPEPEPDAERVRKLRELEALVGGKARP